MLHYMVKWIFGQPKKQSPPKWALDLLDNKVDQTPEITLRERKPHH